MHTFIRSRLLQALLLSCVVAALVVPAQPADAALALVSQGVITSGTDVSGVFGQAGANLGGKSYQVLITYDDFATAYHASSPTFEEQSGPMTGVVQVTVDGATFTTDVTLSFGAFLYANNNGIFSDLFGFQSGDDASGQAVYASHDLSSTAASVTAPVIGFMSYSAVTGDIGSVTFKTSGPAGSASFAATPTSVQLAVPGPHVAAGPDATILKGATFSGNGSFTEVGASSSWSATVDYGDGSGAQPLVLSGMTFSLSHTYTSVGPHNVVVQVTDDIGRSGSDTLVVRVVYAFSGFFPPVVNPPALNVAKAGSAVPVKFSLGGNQGASPFTVASAPIACGSGAVAGQPGAAQSAGASGIQYDPSTDQYQYNWKTDKAWANTCRQLTVTLNDGTVHVANFRLQ